MEIISLRIPLIPSLDIRFKTFNELSLHKKKIKKKKKKDPRLYKSKNGNAISAKGEKKRLVKHI